MHCPTTVHHCLYPQQIPKHPSYDHNGPLVMMTFPTKYTMTHCIVIPQSPVSAPDPQSYPPDPTPPYSFTDPHPSLSSDSNAPHSLEFVFESGCSESGCNANLH